jgi:thiamine biosynthesis lipoprotein
MSAEEGQAAAEAAIAEVERLNALMSTWIDDSPLSQLNREAGEGWVETDAEIYRLLELSGQYSERTGGAFDVTAGPLGRLWGFFGKQGESPPSQEEIDDTLRIVGYRRLRLDPERKAVRFRRTGMEIDFGGIAKGYAVDRAVFELKKLGVGSALVNLGGNISAIGLPEGRSSWSIAVRDPRSKIALIGTLQIDGREESWGIASSGQYERYYEFEGVRYGHIMDPRTGWPVQGMLGVTIFANRAMRADILSTCVYVLGPVGGRRLIVEEQVDGLIILPGDDGGVKIHISKGLADSFQLLDTVTDADIEVF